MLPGRYRRLAGDKGSIEPGDYSMVKRINRLVSKYVAGIPVRQQAALILWVLAAAIVGCSQYLDSPQLPHREMRYSDAIQPVNYRLQRFAIDSRGQAYGVAGNRLYSIDSLNDDLTALFSFDSAILAFHITADDLFIISTDNNHWDEKAPCNLYASRNHGHDFDRIRRIDGGCPVWMSISSDQDYVYIGEYGPRKPRVSKNVWRYDSGGNEWTVIFQAPPDTEAHIHRVAVDPNTGYLWVSVGDTRKNRGVYLSMDQGQTWEEKIDSQATGVAFTADRIYWGKDKKDRGGVFATDSLGRKAVDVFDTRDFGNFQGSIYELITLPNDTLLAPIMKYENASNVASLWHGDNLQWRLLMIFESLPGQGRDTSSIAGPDKNGYVLLTGYKLDWQQL